MGTWGGVLKKMPDWSLGLNVTFDKCVTFSPDSRLPGNTGHWIYVLYNRVRHFFWKIQSGGHFVALGQGISKLFLFFFLRLIFQEYSDF